MYGAVVSDWQNVVFDCSADPRNGEHIYGIA